MNRLVNVLIEIIFGYTQFAIQDSGLFGPNPWKFSAQIVYVFPWSATQPLEQILDSAFLLCELGVQVRLKPARTRRPSGRWAAQARPISLLRLSLLRFADSTIPGNSPWRWEFHPLELRFCSSQTLWTPESQYGDWPVRQRGLTTADPPSASGTTYLTLLV